MVHGSRRGPEAVVPNVSLFAAGVQQGRMQQAVSKRSSPSLVPPAKDMGGRERKLRDLAATAALNAAYDDRIQRERVQSKHSGRAAR